MFGHFSRDIWYCLYGAIFGVYCNQCVIKNSDEILYQASTLHKAWWCALMLRSLHNPSPPPPPHYMMMLSFAWKSSPLPCPLAGQRSVISWAPQLPLARIQCHTLGCSSKMGWLLTWGDVWSFIKLREKPAERLSKFHTGGLWFVQEKPLQSLLMKCGCTSWTVLCSVAYAMLYLFWLTDIKAPAQWAITKIMRSYLQMSVSRLQILSHWLKRLEMGFLRVVT